MCEREPNMKDYPPWMVKGAFDLEPSMGNELSWYRTSQRTRMSYSLEQDLIAAAFSSQTRMDAAKPVRFYTVEIGQLVITTGRIAASDPFVEPSPAPFTRAVPKGSFPVTLAILISANQDERVAFARVLLSQQPAVRWELACTEGQRIERLKPSEYFGYGVDSGTGCVMDPAAGQLLADRMKRETGYCDVIIDGMEKTYQHTRSWYDCRPSRERSENVMCFSSGEGDGSYPSFFGLAADGHAVALITDFRLLSDRVKTRTLSRPPWWRFWGKGH